jgi:hypothetical protein
VIEPTDQIIGRVLLERAQADGMDAAHDMAMLVVCGVLRFIISTKGDSVARGAVSEISGALDLALAFKNIELTGARQ